LEASSDRAMSIQVKQDGHMKFILGIVTGVALGLLFAPAPGIETRMELKRRARDVAEIPKRKATEMAEETKHKAGDLGARVGREAAEAAVQAVRDDLTGDARRA